MEVIKLTCINCPLGCALEVRYYILMMGICGYRVIVVSMLKKYTLLRKFPNLT